MKYLSRAIFSMVIFSVLLITNISLLNAASFSSDMEDANRPAMDISAELKKNPDNFIEVMKKELADGNLDVAGSLAKELIKAKPDDPDPRAVYSMYLSSKNEIDEAKKQLALAKGLRGETLFTLSADAMILQREKKYDDAIEACNKSIFMDEHHPYPRNILGRIYSDMGKPEDARENFKKTVELNPNFLPGYLNLGAVSFLLGNNADSIRYFEKAIALNPNGYMADYGIAVVYEAEGRNKEAIKALEKSRDLAAGNEMILAALGQLQIKERLYENALKTGKEMESFKMESAYEILGRASLQMENPEAAVSYLKKASNNNLEAQYLLGFSHMVNGTYYLALNQMQGVLKKNPLHFGAYSARAVLKLYLGQEIDPQEELTNQWDEPFGKLLGFIRGCVAASKENRTEALNDFMTSEGIIGGFSLTGINEETLEKGIDKEEPKYLAMGVLYYFKNLYNSSMAEFSKALAVNSGSVFANYWAAQVSLATGDRDNAIRFLENSTKIAPKFFSALYAIGELNFITGKPETAITYYQRALSVKNDAGILVKLGLYYEQAENIEEAGKYYEKVIDLYPNLFVGYNQLSWLYAKRGINLDKAMHLALKANDLMPGNGSILDTLGWIHCHKKEFGEAVTFLEQAKDIMPNNPVIFYHLGVAYNGLKEKDFANTNLKKALELSDSFEGAAHARQILESNQNF